MKRLDDGAKRRLALLATLICLHASPTLAGIVAYTDRASFLAAIGGASQNDNFESYASAAIGNGSTLGDFRYSFAPTVQPMVVSGGFGGQALGGPFDVFVGGDAVSLGYTGVAALRAFGMDLLYAPSFETVPADVYRLLAADGIGAGGAARNAPLDSAGGLYFLGLVADPGFEFRQLDLLSVVPLGVGGDPLLIPAYQFDNFIYAAAGMVPEPATPVLMLMGLALLCGLRLTRR